MGEYIERHAVALGALVILGALWLALNVLSASAQGTGARNAYAQVRGSTLAPNRVVILCDGIAEDSLATLRMVKYDEQGTVVYQCTTP